MDANTPILRPSDLLPLLGTTTTPTTSPEPEEAPRGLLRRAWDAWRDPEGRELSHRDHGEYMGRFYLAHGWWTGGEQIGLGVTIQRDQRSERTGGLFGRSRTVRSLFITTYVGPVSHHITVERADA